MGVTRDSFLLRFVKFGPIVDKRQSVRYRDRMIGWVERPTDGSGWSYGFIGGLPVNVVPSRHGATEALLDLWLETRDGRGQGQAELRA